jgi:hypothetical protein
VSNSILNKVYSNLKRFIYHPKTTGFKRDNSSKTGASKNKSCPITGLDISMQPKNSKFLSYTGVKWYYNNNYKTYENILKPKLSASCKNKALLVQFREIAHVIRNTDSNPRNNTRRAIMKILDDKDTLFNNFSLIDKSKLKNAGLNNLPG